MTHIEKDLINLLKENARRSNSDLAALLGVKEEKVKKMITALEKEGVIVQYTAVIHEDKVKDSDVIIRALIELSVRPRRKTGYQHIARRISQYSDVVSHYLVSGNYDFLIIAEGKSLEDISTFVSDKLASIEHITSTSTHFIMKKYKENNVMFAHEDSVDRLMVSV